MSECRSAREVLRPICLTRQDVTQGCEEYFTHAHLECLSVTFLAGNVKEFGFVEIVAGEPEDPGSPRSGGSTVGTGSDCGAASGHAPAAKPSQVST